MTGLQVVLLLSIGITLAAATDFGTTTRSYTKPNCTRCEYFDGIGFLPTDYCNTYVMCFKKPYSKGYYRHEIMCCPNGTSWNQEHLTCKRNPKCDDPRTYCPDVPTTTIMPCPLKKVDGNIYKYSYKLTHEVMDCPWGSAFDEKKCTCIFKGPYAPPCTKILHFNFNDTYDSNSCHNFAVGEPYNFPKVQMNMLCLNGTKKQFLSIPFLNNWFAWNPVAKTFTMCFWLLAKTGSTAGVFSFNCYLSTGDVLAEIWLEVGKLNFKLGSTTISTDTTITYGRWTKVCITFKRGLMTAFVNGDIVPGSPVNVGPWPINTHSNPTIGFVPGKDFLYGYVDDFCFWTEVLSQAEILECVRKGPSTKGPWGPDIPIPAPGK